MGFVVPRRRRPTTCSSPSAAPTTRRSPRRWRVVEEALTRRRGAATSGRPRRRRPPRARPGAAIARSGPTSRSSRCPGARRRRGPRRDRGRRQRRWSSPTTCPSRTRWRSRTQPPARACSSWDPTAAPPSSAESPSASPTSCVPAPSASSPRRARAPSRSCALLDAAGVGVSHCLGVGGRDLSAAVGGRSTRQALAALDADPATERIVVVSKPPAPEVLADLEAYAAGLGTPVHWATLGPGRPDLTAAVEDLARRAAPERCPRGRTWRPGASSGPSAAGGSLRGLFCGGTLADEAMLVAADGARRRPLQHPAAPRPRPGPGPARPPATSSSTSATTR